MIDDKQISLLMFADDEALISSNAAGLQQMLSCLDTWCNKWKLTINGDKAKVVHFRHKSKILSKFQFKCGNTNIDYSKNCKYLGLWFDEYLDYSFTVDQLAKSASRALGSLISKYYTTGGMEYDVYSKLYKSLVLPVMMYGASVWGFKSYKKINMVQNRAAKAFLGLGKFAPNNATIGDIGWSSCLANQIGEVYHAMLRFNDMENSRFNEIVFMWSKSQSKSNESRFHKFLHSMDINYNLNAPCKKQAVKDIVNEVDYNGQVEWHRSIWNDKGNEINGNKLRLYRLFKERIEADHYVKMSMSKEHRKGIARLRSGTFPLQIELGRYKKIPLDQRLCKFCKADCIENEIHFLLDCELYEDLRYQLFYEMCNLDNDFNSYNTLQKICILFTTKHVQPLLGKTIFLMYKRRKLFDV